MIARPTYPSLTRTGRGPSVLRVGWTLTLFATLSCGSDDSNPAASSDDPRDSTNSASRFTCTPPGYSELTEPQAFDRLEGTVVDLDGRPIPDLRAQACGVNVCLNQQSRADGTVIIETDATLEKPRFKYGLGRKYAKFAFPLSGGPIYAIGVHATAALPPPESSVPLQPGAAVASGAVTLELPDEMNPIEVDPFDFDSPELQGFRAVEIPVDKAPPAVDTTLGLELLFAMTPVGTELCPFAGLSLENRLGWQAGAPVEIFLHGVEVSEDWAPYGSWVKVSDGQVSEDGATITTSAGGGIPILSVIGVRRVAP